MLQLLLLLLLQGISGFELCKLSCTHEHAQALTPLSQATLDIPYNELKLDTCWLQALIRDAAQRPSAEQLSKHSWLAV